MGGKRKVYYDISELPQKPIKAQVAFGASGDKEKFIVSSYTLNTIDVDGTNTKVNFPGNIAPEGYFYSPFYEVTLKENEDELQSTAVVRINFVPKEASVDRKTVEYYLPDIGATIEKDMWFITIKAPIPYKAIAGQPFCIYDISKDATYRGFLDSMTGLNMTIATEQEIDESGLTGTIPEASGKSIYIISLMEENAPEYAEFLPSSQKLVWRGLKKMSDLSSESPIYNMPFTNGRNYIHKNLNVFVRRQDPNNDYKLFRPSPDNPLRRFQVEGDAKLDFDYIQTIIDSMVNAC